MFSAVNSMRLPAVRWTTGSKLVLSAILDENFHRTSIFEI
jgi:hypothetical protein